MDWCRNLRGGYTPKGGALMNTLFHAIDSHMTDKEKETEKQHIQEAAQTDKEQMLKKMRELYEIDYSAIT